MRLLQFIDLPVDLLRSYKTFSSPSWSTQRIAADPQIIAGLPTRICDKSDWLRIRNNVHRRLALPLDEWKNFLFNLRLSAGYPGFHGREWYKIKIIHTTAYERGKIGRSGRLLQSLFDLN